MTDPIEIMALAILNSDRVAGGWPPVESRDGIPNSDGFVCDAVDLIAALGDAGFAIAPVEPTEAMAEAAGDVPYVAMGDGEYLEPDRLDIYRAMITAGRVKT